MHFVRILVYINVSVCNNAVADRSRLPELFPGCVRLVEAVAGVRGVIVPGCGSDPVFAAAFQFVCALPAFRVVVLLLVVCCLVIYKAFSA